MCSEAEAFGHHIFNSVDRILACLDGLSREDLNWRPLENANSLYGLALHSLGNIEENILGILSAEPVHRDPEAEFTIQGDSAEPLLQKWNELQQRVTFVLNHLTAVELDRLYELPRYEPMTGREVLIYVVRHTAEHMGHAELTRDLLFSAQGRKLPQRSLWARLKARLKRSLGRIIPS